MKNKSWNVNSFRGIGWPDPFPDEFSSCEKDFLKYRYELVYQEARYSPYYSPFMIYIPSRHVMVKLMRSCLGCETKEDFWIHDYPIM